MKAKELMIGDLVRINGEVVQIESIVPDSKQVIAVGETFCYAYDDGEYEPIPLTEDILKSNGLKWSGTWRAYCKFCEDRNFIMVTYDKEEGFGIHNTRIRFHYVHELQHALRLCGLNELADNFKVN